MAMRFKDEPQHAGALEYGQVPPSRRSRPEAP